MPSLLDQATEKRQKIIAWLATAIGILDAEERGLQRISGMTGARNWSCRESLYDFAQQAAQAEPVLVRVDEKRIALYSLPASAKTTTRQKAPSFS